LVAQSVIRQLIPQKWSRLASKHSANSESHSHTIYAVSCPFQHL